MHFHLGQGDIAHEINHTINHCICVVIFSYNLPSITNNRSSFESIPAELPGLEKEVVRLPSPAPARLEDPTVTKRTLGNDGRLRRTAHSQPEQDKECKINCTVLNEAES